MELGLISSASIISGVEIQGQRVFITQVDFLPVPADAHPRTHNEEGGGGGRRSVSKGSNGLPVWQFGQFVVLN